ncbi:MAG TPA: ABC transporter ATP-binding protein [Candidatus Ratteibacteria bacterium]|jgi:putative ABC transport system ATP-binding protein|uniref:ABC transporter ATP-binding protein YtrE n=1 Tax=candidate division TA06 bacterium ADurb.Bin131 TaxID=1852827 RepID=A0A1V6CDH4_UNCT6|nr:MAG: ABC transporter ATP-binding protein YtrE [candidate division TA06 bacterium ADurb.Bin131]HOC03340.1 ABC transporter ATP-binding protein [bacterium]HRS06135.1 ABC transporter ATP-binding protein [Candidatus Ratteibacteria bacterium]HON05557.1 ABC transporter ATP-binding protein [bacterium]HPC29834.1 ABC transporter ATP-binding protein [bacterium]
MADFNEFIIQTENVSRIYEADIKALDNISVSIPREKITVILGPSGSGKTTLLNILALLDTPDSGRVFLNGRDVSCLSERESAEIRNRTFGFVFQFFHLIPELTVEENIMVPLMIRQPALPLSAHRETVLRLLTEFHLEKKSNRYPNHISGGEKQKVCICRSMVGDPDIIFADEPTGNLDRESSFELISLIQTLNKNRGKTFVIATHNENFLKISANVIYLSDGKITIRSQDGTINLH